MDEVRAHEDAVSGVAVASDLLVSVSWDSSVKAGYEFLTILTWQLWKFVPSGGMRTPLSSFLEHDCEVRCVDASSEATLQRFHLIFQRQLG